MGEIVFDAFSRGGRPREKLARLLEGYFDFLDREPEFTRLLQWENLEKGRHLAKENHLLSKNPFLARFRAIIEDGVLEELYVERTSQDNLVGNIYKGRIVNIEPSIQAAFVDFGVGRNGFLHISDVEPQYYRQGGLDPDKAFEAGEAGGRGAGEEGEGGADQRTATRRRRVVM